METIRNKANTLFKHNIPAHIVTNEDSWFNGYITKITDDYLSILDRKHKKDKLVFYADIRIFTDFDGDYSTLIKPEVKE